MAFRHPEASRKLNPDPKPDAVHNLQLHDEDTMASLDLYMETLEEVSGNKPSGIQRPPLSLTLTPSLMLYTTYSCTMRTQWPLWISTWRLWKR